MTSTQTRLSDAILFLSRISVLEKKNWKVLDYYLICDSVYSHSFGLINKSCQPDLRFLEHLDVACGTTTLQLGSDVVDLDSGDFRDVTLSDVEDDINLQGRVLIVLSQACDSLFPTPPLRLGSGSTRNVSMLWKTLSLVDKIYF